MFAAQLCSLEKDQDQVVDTSVTESCCPDDLVESIQRRGSGLMSFLLLMSCKSVVNLSFCDSSSGPFVMFVV